MTISKNRIRSWGVALCFILGAGAMNSFDGILGWALGIGIYTVGWLLVDPLVKKADFIDR